MIPSRAAGVVRIFGRSSVVFRGSIRGPRGIGSFAVVSVSSQAGSPGVGDHEAIMARCQCEAGRAQRGPAGEAIPIAASAPSACASAYRACRME